MGQDHARDLRLCRAGRDLHRPHQPPQQSLRIARPSTRPIPAASSRCRLTAPACSARSIWPSWSSDPFTPRRGSTSTRLARAGAAIAVRMMDNAIDVSRFPLPQQQAGGHGQAPHRAGRHRAGRCADPVRRCAMARREAVALTESWLGAIQRAAYLASAELAAREGRLPAVRPRALSGRRDRRGLDADIRDAIAKHGIRNALLTSIAPTGTISLFADNVSSGIEPVFSFSYTRKVLMPDGTRREEEVTRLCLSPVPPPERRGRAAARLFRRRPDAGARPIMSWCRRRCRNTSTARSPRPSTCPADISFDAFKDVYLAGL